MLFFKEFITTSDKVIVEVVDFCWLNDIFQQNIIENKKKWSKKLNLLKLILALNKLMYLNDLEETVVLIAAVFIIIAFIVKTYKDIKETIAEEKQKLYEKNKNEEKVKNLIEYIETKSNLIKALVKAKKIIKEKKKNN